jgi:hypothetical protein
METLREAYSLAKQNDGAPGVNGVTFEAIETQRVDAFLKQRGRHPLLPLSCDSTPLVTLFAASSGAI